MRDRGADVALRLAVDHPDGVERLAILDGVPICEALDRADARFATWWWLWFFFAQPDKPEQAVLADPQPGTAPGPSSRRGRAPTRTTSPRARS